MQKKSPKTIYKKRAFLNTDLEMQAFIIAHLQEFGGENLQKVWADPTLKISDCYRTISLDFSFYNSKDMKIAQKKLEKFTGIINQFKTLFDSQVDAYEKRKSVTERERKK